MKDNMALKTIKGSLKESDCENVYIVTGQGFSWRTERKNITITFFNMIM